ARERGRVELDPLEEPRWSRNGNHSRQDEVELKTRGLRWGERIVLLGQKVKDENLARFPLLRACQYGEGLPRGMPGHSDGQSAGGVEGAPGRVSHADEDHVVALAGNRLERLDQDLLEGRVELRVDGRRVGDSLQSDAVDRRPWMQPRGMQPRLICVHG